MRDGSARWRILALLFTARTAMAVQFQAVGALSPLFAADYGVGLADIGLLIGLYLAPGIAFALPGGALGARFGEREVVLVGLGPMVGGGTLAIAGGAYEAQVAGRLIAGAGGVIINVLMTKMATDWFAGREIATAMGLFVNSWPFGIAFALAVLPWVAEAGGLEAALGATVVFAALCLGLMATFYRDPPRPAGSAPVAAWPAGPALTALCIAGVIWALFNAALAMLFGFGPALLTERGMPLVAASGMTSIVLWLASVSVPLGGILADRLGRRDLVMLIGLAGFAAGLAAARAGVPPLAAFILIGLLSGLAAAPILSLAAAVLRPETRSAGMGLFYTIYYGLMLVCPWLAGEAAAAAGSAAMAFDLAVAMLAACVALLGAFRMVVGRARVAAAPGRAI